MKGPLSREWAKGSPMGEKEGESREEKKGSDAALENNLPVILLLKSSKEIILPLWLFFAAISSSAPLSFPVVKRYARKPPLLFLSQTPGVWRRRRGPPPRSKGKKKWKRERWQRQEGLVCYKKPTAAITTSHFSVAWLENWRPHTDGTGEGGGNEFYCRQLEARFAAASKSRGVGMNEKRPKKQKKNKPKVYDLVISQEDWQYLFKSLSLLFARFYRYALACCGDFFSAVRIA